MSRPWWVKPGGAALVPVAAVLTLAVSACGGGSGSPAVATVATTSASGDAAGGNRSGTASSPVSNQDPAELLVKWTACMRSHGDPEQTDPSIDNHWGINITIPLSAPETLSNEVHGGTAPCNQYLAAAGNALKAEHPAPAAPSNEATGVKYAACMRANGVPNYPDPTGSGNQTDLRGIDMNSPFFIRANKLCGRQIGAPAWWINGWGPPGDISVSNIPPGCLPPSTRPGCLPHANRPRSGGTTTTSGATPAPGG